ncbi:type IV secretory system conjugative DNA transfer family protein [Ruegeria sp. HKCCA4812]|uniref:type IV secretory system conjugative DNA transfer family protein n=1 Tax=Ruegeria sp. HKCCA4812 TaxID=2682993 RepID=UPI001488D176|nr:type IV secretory system conjugative DNA transfer family protein [Ruegeria sp. HKCCA4812]
MEWATTEHLILLALLVILLMILLSWRFDNKNNTTFGAARWCTVWDLFKAKLFQRKGLYVGDWAGRLGLYYHGAHAVTFGVTGSGKGVSAIVPNMLEQRFMFVVDPGGENTAIASKTWQARGIEFKCINPFGMLDAEPTALPAHGFNPLAVLNPDSRSFAADALLFAEMLTPRTGEERGGAAYFKDAATAAKRAMILHIVTREPDERRNIATLYEYAYSDAAGWAALIAAMKANPVCGNLVALEANKLERTEAQAPEEFSAVMSTIQQDLDFLADPMVREHFSRDDVDFSILKGIENPNGGIITVVIPLEYIESHGAITRLAMACAVLSLQREPYAARPVTFLIDEAASLGTIKRLPNWLATLRKYNVRFWTIWQNIGQVEHLYGRNWQTIISNCGLLQILGVGDLQTAQYTSSMIGQCTVRTVTTNAKGEQSVSQTARPLLMPEELLRTDDGMQIVLIGTLWPAMLKKVSYWKQPRLAGRYHDNPYRDTPTPRHGALDGLADLWGKFYYMLVWWMAPHPLAACIIVIPVVLGLLSVFGGGQ